METQCQGLLVKSVCAFHYQTTVQPRAFTIPQFNRAFFFFFHRWDMSGPFYDVLVIVISLKWSIGVEVCVRDLMLDKQKTAPQGLITRLIQ